MTKRLYTLLFILGFGIASAYCQNQDIYEKVIKLANDQECESAIDLLHKNEGYFKTLATSKKLESFLSIPSNCKDPNFKSNSLDFLDSIIHHPQALKYPKITRQAYLLKSNFLMFERKKTIDLLLQQEKFETATGNDSTLAACLLKIGGTYFMYEKYDLARGYYANTLNLTNSTNDSILAYVGLANTAQTNPYLADSLFQEALQSCENIQDSLRRASTLKVYGTFLNKHGRYKKALDYLVRGVNLFPQSKRFGLSRSNTYLDISLLFLEMGDTERAKQYIQKSIKICEDNNYKTRNGFVAITYGKILRATGDLATAKEEFLKSYNHSKKRNKLNSLIGSISFIGLIAVEEDNIAAADYFYKEGLNIYNQLKTESNKNIFLLFSGQRFKLLKQYQKSEESFEALLSLGKKRGRAEMQIRALTELSKLKQETGDFENALSHYKSYKFLEDSIYHANQKLLVFDIESKYNRAEQDKAIAILDAKDIKAQSTLSKQNSIITIGGIALLFISILSFFLFNLYNKVTQQKKQIGKTLNEKDTLLREIHHRVKNNLQLVSSLLSLQSRHVEDANALEVLNSGKSRIRSMALIHQDLYNRENLTGVSVREYFEKLCNELCSTFQINTNKINLQIEIEDLQLDVDTLVPLGLIINELLTNALKYAFPEGKQGEIIVKLFERDNQLQLEIKDNGIGIDSSQKSESSFGYKLINTLLHQLKGKIRQESNKGTQIFLTIDHYKIAA